jgi:hypothetical protein
MTPDDVKRIQTTWGLVIPIRDKAAALFYGKLFEPSKPSAGATSTTASKTPTTTPSVQPCSGPSNRDSARRSRRRSRARGPRPTVCSRRR